MPVSPWSEIVGHKCALCGLCASHWYCLMPICCDCHVGEINGGLFSQEEIASKHAEYANGVVIDDDAEIDRYFAPGEWLF